jgi:DNA mismatch repair ATPase MutS
VVRIAAPVLGILWVLSIVAWVALSWVAPIIVLSLVNLMLTYRFRTRVEKAAGEIAQAMDGLDLLTAIFGEIERQEFAAPKTAALRRRLFTGKESASGAIARLSHRVAWFESHDNMFVKFADLFIFWTAQCVFSIEDWRSQYGSRVRDWIAVLGEIEALNALAGYTFERPDNSFPQFVERGPLLLAEELAHPLLPSATAVGNDVKLDSELQLWVVSGPNMAGKSTFIRSVGVNVVLAQAGAPVRARALTLSRLNVAASICVLDSLQGGLSRFYSEILRLKLIDERSRGAVPVLFLLDELLSGTNSHDRRVGTESFVRILLERCAIGLITTHDLALAEIAEDMAGRAANFHFQDTFENGELRFDYRLSPGIVSTANALKLMRSIGLEV